MNKRMQRVTNWLGMQRQSADVIDEGYRWLLGRPADPAGMDWLCSRLQGLPIDQVREQVRAILTSSEEFARRHFPIGSRGRDGLCTARIGGVELLVVRNDFTEVAGTIGQYEENVLGSLLEDAATADVIVDIGANIGLIAVPVAAAQRAGGRTYCLEISQHNVKVLLENAKRNKLDNIIAFPIGASDSLETTPMQVQPRTTLNTLSRVAGDLFADRTEMVLSVPIDMIFADGRYGAVDIVKIDTDGYEYRVLAGAREILRKHRPIVYLEYCPQLSMSVLGVPGETILKMLGDYGYQATVLHRLKPIEPLGALPVDEMIAKVTQLWQADIDAGMSHLDIRWHIPPK